MPIEKGIGLFDGIIGIISISSKYFKRGFSIIHQPCGAFEFLIRVHILNRGYARKTSNRMYVASSQHNLK